MAQLGFEEGIGFIPFAGIGWEAIKRITKDDSSPVRAAAAKVLAKDPDPAATKALAEAAGDESWLVRAAALEALAKRGDPSALDPVEQSMSDEKEAVRYTAAAAVLRLIAIKESGLMVREKKKKEKEKEGKE
jgi:HEAT repeat protein